MDHNQAKKALYEICKVGGSGAEERVREILNKNPNLINEDLDEYSDTILMYASYYNHIKIIKLLLSYDNININKQNRNDGFTALHYASSNGYKEIVKLLLSHPNININIRSSYGKLASDICCDYIEDKSNKAIILELFENHSKAKTALTSSTITPSKHSNEGSLSSNNVIPQTTLKKSSIVEEVKDRELLRVVEEKESFFISPFLSQFRGIYQGIQSMLLMRNDYDSQGKSIYLPLFALAIVVLITMSCYQSTVKCFSILALFLIVFGSFYYVRQSVGKAQSEPLAQKLQIEGLEEKMREITSNNLKQMQRHLQEKENYMKEVDYMKNNRNEIVRVLQENNKMMVDNLMKEIKQTLNHIERRFEETEKNQNLRMERRLEEYQIKEKSQMEERLKKIENSQKDFEKRLEEKERSLVLKPLPLPPNKQTHVFLTHTWREDEKGRNNHDRVGRVNEALRKRGLVTWFDSERMSGTVRQAMTDALDATCCVLIFITKKYEEKVNSRNEADNCYFEFNVAAHDNYLANMRIPIVMEECMLNEKGWQGRLKTEMGHQLYFDLSSDDKDVFEERCNEVFVRVVKLLNI